MNANLQARIIIAAQNQLRVLAAKHAQANWADSDAYERYAATYRDVTFQPLGDTAILAVTPKGRTQGAADALDFAAGTLDNGDGYISTDTTESLVVYYLSTTPDLARMIKTATGV